MRFFRQAALQLLRICIGGNEIHAWEIQRDHVVHRIAPATADTDDGDARREIGMRRFLIVRLSVMGLSPGRHR